MWEPFGLPRWKMFRKRYSLGSWEGKEGLCPSAFLVFSVNLPIFWTSVKTSGNQLQKLEISLVKVSFLEPPSRHQNGSSLSGRHGWQRFVLLEFLEDLGAVCVAPQISILFHWAYWTKGIQDGRVWFLVLVVECAIVQPQLNIEKEKCYQVPHVAMWTSCSCMTLNPKDPHLIRTAR